MKDHYSQTVEERKLRRDLHREVISWRAEKCALPLSKSGKEVTAGWSLHQSSEPQPTAP